MCRLQNERVSPPYEKDPVMQGEWTVQQQYPKTKKKAFFMDKSSYMAVGHFNKMKGESMKPRLFFKKRSICSAMLCFLIQLYISGQEYTKTDLDQLIAAAAALDTMSNVSAREYYEAYFNLGDAYFQFENPNAALEAYKKGLQLNAWEYEYQMKCARIELEAKKYFEANNRLIFIIKRCEDESTRKEAMSLREKIDPSDMTAGKIIVPDKSDYSLYLVPLGDVDTLIMDAIRSRISQEFNISVEIIEKPSALSPKNIRDRKSDYFNRFVVDYIGKHSKKEYLDVLAQAGVKEKDALSPDAKKQFVYMMYMKEKDGEELWDTLTRVLKDQYDADVLLSVIIREHEKLITLSKSFGILGVTEEDIYAQDYNFLFGWAKKSAGVMSYSRFLDDGANYSKTIKRAVMQAFSSAGNLMGIERCTSGACSRAYPNSLIEHDKKEDILCEECKKKLKTLFESLK